MKKITKEEYEKMEGEERREVDDGIDYLLTIEMRWRQIQATLEMMQRGEYIGKEPTLKEIVEMCPMETINEARSRHEKEWEIMNALNCHII